MHLVQELHVGTVNVSCNEAYINLCLDFLCKVFGIIHNLALTDKNRISQSLYGRVMC